MSGEALSRCERSGRVVPDEPFTESIQAFLRTSSPVLIVSDFAAAEFASAIARRLRMGVITRGDARHIFSTFDIWSAQFATCELTASADLVCATAFLRRLDLTLRAPDAINIAIAQRVDAELATFDKNMATSARKLQTSVVRL